MKKIILLNLIIFAAAFFSSVSAQRETPPGAGDKDLRDNNVRMRSNELERIKRDTDKPKSGA